MLAQRVLAFPAQMHCLCRKRFARFRSKSLIPAYSRFGMSKQLYGLPIITVSSERHPQPTYLKRRKLKRAIYLYEPLTR